MANGFQKHEPTSWCIVLQFQNTSMVVCLLLKGPAFSVDTIIVVIKQIRIKNI